MSGKKYTYMWEFQPYKTDKGISRIETAPSNARPLSNGVWNKNQISTSIDGNAFLPRPIKHWRKQLQTDPIRGGSKSKNIIEVSQPGGTTFLNGNINQEIECCENGGITTKVISYIDIEKNNNFCKTVNCSYTVTAQDVANGWNGPIGKKICCNPEKNIIKRATTLLSKKYYSDSRSYLKSRNRLHNQKQTLSQVPNVEYYKDGKELYPNNDPLGPQTFLMPDCVNICKIQPVTIYKPNNRNFSIQGATDSSNRTNKLRYDTVKTAALSLENKFGKSAANAGKYLINYTTPYNIKSKYQKPDSCCFRSSVSGTFIYNFNSSGVRAFRGGMAGNIPLPIISTTSLIYDYTVETIGSITQITINYTFYTDDPDTNDGLSFYKSDKSIVDFYNNLGGNLTITQFGDIPLSKGGNQFSELTNLVFDTNSGAPTMPFFGTSLANCFYNCTNFNSNLDLWDTSNVTSMKSMFESNIGIQNIFSANKFNNGETTLLDLTGDMSSATYTANLRLLTCSGANFTGELTDKDILFLEVSGNIVYYGSVLNITSDTSLNLYNLSSFTNITSGNILSIKKSINGTKPLNWNTSNVTDMSNMFKSCAYFNQYIGSWDTTRVTDMSLMFYQDIIFNNSEFKEQSGQPLLWNTSNVKQMIDMFRLDRAFNQNISTSGDYWNVSNVISLNGMFREAYLFNQNISNWDTSENTSMNAIFFQAQSFNNGEPPGSSTAPLTWNTSKVTIMESAFRQQNAFNQDISSFDTSNVTRMSLMFQLNGVFNQNIGGWNVSKVTAMNGMFQSAIAFNNGETGLQSIANITPQTSSYANTDKLLNCPGATFNSTLSIGDVLIIQTPTIVYSSSIESITDDENLVLTNAYGANITSSNITSIDKQIAGTSPLNWDTSNVTNLSSMFQNCTFFNQNITTNGSIWDTNKVTTLASMFFGTPAIITLFNNGEIITGTTSPMGWTFNAVPLSGNYRTNCRLTLSNKPASLS